MFLSSLIFAATPIIVTVCWEQMSDKKTGSVLDEVNY